MLIDFTHMDKNEQPGKINGPIKATNSMFLNEQNIIDGFSKLQTVEFIIKKFDVPDSLLFFFFFFLKSISVFLISTNNNDQQVQPAAEGASKSAIG